ncbi:MAG: protein kinase [Planctomycetes bacterium]|nr:protein kinase [Planctomycetota bacterium]
MAENTDPKSSSNPESIEPVGDTRRLEKATEDIASGAIDGTLMSIEAHTGQHPVAPPEEDPSVTDSLKKAKGGGALPATMYGPTRPGQAKVGSTAATQFGPTDVGRPPSGAVPMPASGPGTMGTGGGAVAPFGGKIMVGTRVGQIEITGVLGKGGMGEVFRGYHHALDIQVAIKVLPDELSRNDLVRQRFLREARLCVKLDHPNIVRVYNVDEHAGNLFLVMEIIEGTDAANMLKNGGRFKYRRALEIGAASADALGYAHTQGLVHRDVKPHNILLGREDGKIKLSDFGLARAATSSSHLTMSGQIMGTPHYMSPEQAESKEVTDKADVYSLGVTMYHMLTGETPFVGDTPISVAVQHIAKEILYPEARFAAFPKELVAVLKRMTAKDASKRCSAKQAAVWLRKLISMAPSEDIQVAPDAMQTLAPVVRESQAFEAAAKQREAQDERAREAARTMIATMREVPAIPPTMQVAQQPSQPTITPMPQKKSGGIAAAAAVLLLLGGGGAAAWWFTMGPGASKAGNAPIVAGGNESGSPGDNRGTTGVDPRDNTSTTPAGNNPRSNGGDTNPPANNGTDNPPANNSPDIPPVREDVFINTKLEAALNAIAGASGLADLDIARKRLEEVQAELGRASQRQRDEHKDLQERYQRQFALLSAREHMGAIRAGLATFDRAREGDRATALLGLNGALTAAEALEKVVIPSQVEELVRDDRAAVTRELDKALADFEGEILAESAALEGKKKYNEAAESLGHLLALKIRSERLEALKIKRAELQTRGRHGAILGALERAAAGDHAKLAEADRLLEEAEKAGVPESMAASHAGVRKSVRDAVTARFDAVLAAAGKSADEGNFAAAKATLESSDELPLNSDQKVRVADEVFFLSLREQIHLADKCITDGQLADAKLKLDDAKGRIDGASKRSIPAQVSQRYESVRTRFDAQLSQKFENLLAAAEADMKERDFAGAGKNLAEASDLPLTRDQRNRLDDFNDANQVALAEYVVELIELVEKSLNAGDFETARDALAKANAMPIPDDSQKKLVMLQGRFSTEAIRLHSELLAAGEKALDDRRYEAVQKALESMAKVPVEETRRGKERELAERYLKVLGEDCGARLKNAEKQMEDGKFKDARASIDSALGLPLTPELREKVKLKNEALDSRIETALADLLKKSADNCAEKLFYESSRNLADAEAMREVLKQAQLIRLSDAQDAHRKALRACLDELFRDLQSAVDRGLESEGKKVIEKIEKQPMGEGDKNRLKTLSGALTGETEAARLSRMPEHLKKLANDRYCKSEQLIKVGEQMTSLFATADGKFGAAGTESGKVIFYNLKRGTQLGQSTSGRRKVTSICINSTGTVAAAGNDDGALVLFDPTGGKAARPLDGLGDIVTGLAFSPDGKVLYALTRKGEVARYNAENGSKLNTTPTGIDRAFAFAVSPDGNYLAAGGRDAKIAVFDAQRMVLRETLECFGDDQIQSLNFSADSRQLFAGSIGNDVAIWDTQRLTKKPVRQFKGLSEWLRGAGFSADGRRVAALDNEKRLIVWDAGTATELRKIEFAALSDKNKSFVVTAGWVSPDGTMLIGTRDGDLIHMTVRSAG